MPFLLCVFWKLFSNRYYLVPFLGRSLGILVLISKRMRLGLILFVVLACAECWGFSPDVFTRASAATGIPVELLLAISHVESGFHPSAINIAGQSFLPSSRDEAEWILRRSRDNVDIGLMQINWAHWGKRLGLSKLELLDPWLNVLLGARILEHCVQVSGSWWKGVGLYHSVNESRQREYIEKVWRSYRRLLVIMRK
jgi:transglycosylase-like protein with SLT domain